MTKKIKWQGCLKTFRVWKLKQTLPNSAIPSTYSYCEEMPLGPTVFSERALRSDFPSSFIWWKLWSFLLWQTKSISAMTTPCFFNMMLKAPHKDFSCHLNYSFSTIPHILWLCCWLIKVNWSLSCLFLLSAHQQKS